MFLGDYSLGVCRGCKNCFERGEGLCPLKDERDVLIEKVAAADGVVFASPNYSFQVSAITKAFLDGLGFAFHRPRFQGKASTAIVVQGFHGGGKIVKYLGFVGGGLGFNVVKGSCVRTLEPMDEKALAVMKKKLARHAWRFHAQLPRPAYPRPSLLGLMVFGMGRTSGKLMLGEDKRDYIYYRDKGWFESDYFYPTRLGLPRKAAGAFFDWAAARLYQPRDRRPAQVAWIPRRLGMPGVLATFFTPAHDENSIIAHNAARRHRETTRI